MRRRRILAIVAVSAVAVLAATAAVLGVGQRSELARAASAPIPAFPPHTDCQAYKGDGEVRLAQVAITVQAMLRLRFGNPSRVWAGRVPVATTDYDVEDHYRAAMPAALRRNLEFPDLGVDSYLWVWSHEGWFGGRALAVAFVEYPYSGVVQGRPPVADFKWVIVVDSNQREKLDAEPDPPCGR